MNAVAAEDLVLRYGPTVALDSSTFAIPTGSITAVIGPNGSGKSTLLSAVAGANGSVFGEDQPCAVVMGAGGETYGLALYDSLADAQAAADWAPSSATPSSTATASTSRSPSPKTKTRPRKKPKSRPMNRAKKVTMKRQKNPKPTKAKKNRRTKKHPPNPRSTTGPSKPIRTASRPASPKATSS